MQLEAQSGEAEGEFERGSVRYGARRRGKALGGVRGVVLGGLGPSEPTCLPQCSEDQKRLESRFKVMQVNVGKVMWFLFLRRGLERVDTLQIANDVNSYSLLHGCQSNGFRGSAVFLNSALEKGRCCTHGRPARFFRQLFGCFSVKWDAS